jgi:hypothetical protein
MRVTCLYLWQNNGHVGFYKVGSGRALMNPVDKSKFEVNFMTTPRRNSYSTECLIDPFASFGEGGPRLDDYLQKSTQKLDAITELATQGEAVDGASRGWMLEQVDFIVETIGDEGLELSDEQRSNLLQLLLSIANLNEQIRRQASLSL